MPRKTRIWRQRLRRRPFRDKKKNIYLLEVESFQKWLFSLPKGVKLKELRSFDLVNSCNSKGEKKPRYKSKCQIWYGTFEKLKENMKLQKLILALRPSRWRACPICLHWWIVEPSPVGWSYQLMCTVEVVSLVGSPRILWAAEIKYYRIPREICPNKSVSVIALA